MTTPPGTNPQSQEPGGERRGDGEVPLQHGQTSQFGQPGAGAYGKREAAGTHGSPVLFRPMQVTIAAALAWLGSVLMILFGLLLMFGAAAEPAELGLSGQAAQAMDFLTNAGIGMVLWGLVVLVVALFAFRRANWARWVLVALGTLAVLLNLFGLFQANVFALIAILWIGASVALLMTGPSATWYLAGRGGTPSR